jgi:hypothetical protein
MRSKCILMFIELLMAQKNIHFLDIKYLVKELKQTHFVFKSNSLFVHIFNDFLISNNAIF